MTDPHWSIACIDPFGRDRAMMVLVEDGEVVVVAPPGSSAVLSVQQSRRLGLALDAAAGSAIDAGSGSVNEPWLASNSTRRATRTRPTKEGV